MGPMSFHPPLGHGEALQGLWDAARSDRLPHALILRGPEGIGKYHAARWLALGLLCEAGPGEPCLTCGPCRRAQADSHADLFLVDPLAVGQDRMTIHFIVTRENRPPSAYSGPSIEDFLRLRADEGGWRIVCLRDVDSMNDNAQNAFLKALEEPGENTLLLLTSARPDALLETIQSRTVSVDLGPLSQDDTLIILERDALLPGLEESSQREVLARWSLGAPGKAMKLAQRGGVPSRRLHGPGIGVAAGWSAFRGRGSPGEPCPRRGSWAPGRGSHGRAEILHGLHPAGEAGCVLEPLP